MVGANGADNVPCTRRIRTTRPTAGLPIANLLMCVGRCIAVMHWEEI